MTLPPVIRIFFAIDLAEPTKVKLMEIMRALKKSSRSQGIRWTRPENFHVTLQFLAEVRREHLPLLIANVRAKLATVSQNPEMKFGAINIFPNPYRPRVIVLEVLAQEKLAELSKLIGEGIQATQYEIEGRPFRAHLTLGRIKQPRAMNLSFIEECSLPEFDTIVVDNVALFRSEPQPEGSLYTVLDRISLNPAVSECFNA